MARKDSRGAWDRHLTKTFGQVKALFTVEETREILGCSRSALYSLIGSGTLAMLRVESSPRITRVSLLDYLSGRPEPSEHGQDACATNGPQQQQLF